MKSNYFIEFDFTVFNEGKAYMKFGNIEIETTLEQHKIRENRELKAAISRNMENVIGKDVIALRINKIVPKKEDLL